MTSRFTILGKGKWIITIDPNTSGSAGRDPILRTVPRPGDINTNGHIFGSWVFSQMDIAGGIVAAREALGPVRSEEHTSELQSLMRISYAVFCLKKKTKPNKHNDLHKHK